MRVSPCAYVFDAVKAALTEFRLTDANTGCVEVFCTRFGRIETINKLNKVKDIVDGGMGDGDNPLVLDIPDDGKHTKRYHRTHSTHSRQLHYSLGLSGPSSMARETPNSVLWHRSYALTNKLQDSTVLTICHSQ